MSEDGFCSTCFGVKVFTVYNISFVICIQSYSKLKDALRVCAAFRGTYLDYRDKAEILNENNQKELTETM